MGNRIAVNLLSAVGATALQNEIDDLVEDTAELATSTRGVAMAAALDPTGRGILMVAAVATGGLDTPASKTGDLAIVVAEGGSVAAAQTAIDEGLAAVAHATNSTGDTTVAGEVTVASDTFFTDDDVGRVITVDGEPRTITGVDITEEVAATGSITFIAVASLVDGETITVGDGTLTKVFEIDKAGNGVTGGRVQVNVSADTTAAEVRARFKTAFDAAGLAITSALGTSPTLDLTHSTPGAAGNVTISDTVANAGLTHTGMSGGVDASTTVTYDDDAEGALDSDTGLDVVLLGASVLQKLHVDLTLVSGRQQRVQVTAVVGGQIA